MWKQNIIRAFLFAVFCGIGVLTLSGSVLCNDLLKYYRNRQVLRAAEELLEQLESLNADYDALLEQLEEEPDFIKRIGPAILGTEPADSNIIYPRVTVRQLAAARKISAEDSSLKVAEPTIPEWLSRCSEPRRRTILFLAGAFLVLISFIFFGPVRQTERDCNFIRNEAN